MILQKTLSNILFPFYFTVGGAYSPDRCKGYELMDPKVPFIYYICKNLPIFPILTFEFFALLLSISTYLEIKAINANFLAPLSPIYCTKREKNLCTYFMKSPWNKCLCNIWLFPKYFFPIPWLEANQLSEASKTVEEWEEFFREAYSVDFFRQG